MKSSRRRDACAFAAAKAFGQAGRGVEIKSVREARAGTGLATTPAPATEFLEGAPPRLAPRPGGAGRRLRGR